MAHVLAGLGDSSQRAEHQQHAQVGYGIGEDTRRVRDHDAPRRGRDVDVVVADAYIGDDAQRRSAGHHVVVDAIHVVGSSALQPATRSHSSVTAADRHGP